MAKSFEDGFKDIFLAGVGALALTGEKAKEVVDTLIEKGSITVEQGKDINQELKHKATETASKVQEDVLQRTLKTMSPEERDKFADMVVRLVAESKMDSQTEIIDDESAGEESSQGDKCCKGHGPGHGAGHGPGHKDGCCGKGHGGHNGHGPGHEGACCKESNSKSEEPQRGGSN